MRKIILSAIVLLAIMVSSVDTIHAQLKVGYTNTFQLLAEMPEVKQANARLEAFEKQLSKQGEAMVSKLQNKFTDAQQRQAKGELTPQQIAALETELQQEQLEIQKFQSKAQEDLATKRNELFEPILTEVDIAIKAVADEQGFNYIFDAGSNALLYAVDETNITDQVKAKLGIQ